MTPVNSVPAPGGVRTGTPATRGAGPAAALFLLAAPVAAIVATRWPIPVTVFGLAVFGAVHVALELRYVVGRFSARLRGSLGLILLALLTLAVLSRLVATAAPAAGRTAEIIVCMLLLAYAVGVGLDGTGRIVGLAVVVTLTVAALAQPAWYFFTLTHIHNLIPLFFLWDWSRRLPSEARRMFLGVQALWAVVIPTAVVLGALDRFISVAPGPASAWVGDGARVLAAAAPPGADAHLAARFAVAFAFLQTMHYVVWIVFFPRFAPDVTAEFGRRFPRLAGWRLPVIAAVAGIALLAVFGFDYGDGRTIYSMLAAYHVYVEFPILVWLLAGAAGSRPAAGT